MSNRGVSTGTIVGVIILIVVVGIGAYYFLSMPGGPEGETREFTVTAVEVEAGGALAFDPATLAVNVGDTVVITLENPSDNIESHTLEIEEFGVETDLVAPGLSDTIQFTADEAGTYTYFCNIADHQERGMEGTLTVSP